MKTKKITLLGVLLSLMLILGLIEKQFVLVPGVPGIKPGLSNVVLMYALCLLGTRDALGLLLMKVVLSGLLFAGISGMAYAFCGGVLAFITMWLLLKTKAFGLPGVSVSGAVMHMLGQILCSRLLLGSWAAAAQLPILLLSAVITGIINGVIANLVIGAINKTKLFALAGLTDKEEKSK